MSGGIRDGGPGPGAGPIAQIAGGSRIGVLLTDPGQPDNPITYADRGFTLLTGYDRHQAIGRTWFLQGEATEADAPAAIRRALAEVTEMETVLTKLRKDGTPFRNRLLIAPILDRKGRLTACFEVQRKGTEEVASRLPDTEAKAEACEALPMLQELQPRVKNHLAMGVSFIRL